MMMMMMMMITMMAMTMFLCDLWITIRLDSQLLMYIIKHKEEGQPWQRPAHPNKKFAKREPHSQVKKQQVRSKIDGGMKIRARFWERATFANERGSRPSIE